MESDKKQYLVVEFPAEEGINGEIPMAIISSTWIEEKDGCIYCYWPSYFKSDSQKDKAIQNHWILKEDKCSLCPIIIKYSSDNYNYANAKLQTLEDNSSQYESENEERKRRVPKKKVFSDYEDDFTDSDLEIPSVPLPKKNSSLHSMVLANCGKKIVLNNSSSQFNETERNTVRKENVETGNCETKNSINGRKTNEDHVIRPRPSGNLRSQVNSYETSTTEGQCNGCKENRELLREVLRQLERTREDVKYLIRLNSQKENLEPFVDNFPPFEEVDNVTEFNSELKEDNFVKACSRFQLVGRKDQNETTRKILSKLVSHKLSLQMNWSGRNEKGGFKSLENIIKLIHVCVRKNPLAKNATLTEIENTIKIWLRNAPDREGGRVKRSNKEK